MFDMSLYLGILGFAPDTRPSLTDLKARWKDQCRKCHPDTGGDAEEFKKITNAYKILTDPDYRQRAMQDEIRRGNRNLRGDLNVRIVVPVSFDEAFFGRMVHVSFNRQHLNASMKPIRLDVQDVVNFLVQMPPGSCQGHEFMIRGGGHISDGVTGDGIISFAVQPHDKFSVAGQDVVSTEMIPLDIMVKGGQVDVPTMYGTKTAKVRAGSKNGDRVKIKRCGVAERGDHAVVLEAIFPTRDDLKGKAWEGLPIDFTEEHEVDKEYDGLMQVFTTLSSNHIVSR